MSKLGNTKFQYLFAEIDGAVVSEIYPSLPSPIQGKQFTIAGKINGQNNATIALVGLVSSNNEPKYTNNTAELWLRHTCHAPNEVPNHSIGRVEEQSRSEILGSKEDRRAAVVPRSR